MQGRPELGLLRSGSCPSRVHITAAGHPIPGHEARWMRPHVQHVCPKNVSLGTAEDRGSPAKGSSLSLGAFQSAGAEGAVSAECRVQRVVCRAYVVQGSPTSPSDTGTGPIMTQTPIPTAKARNVKIAQCATRSPRKVIVGPCSLGRPEGAGLRRFCPFGAQNTRPGPHPCFLRHCLRA